jgi:Uncharacterized conserved protein
MSIALRVILVVVSIVTALYVLIRIRKSKAKIEDSIFWIMMAIVLVIFSVFPFIVEWAAHVIGIMSPVNFVFLTIIFILLIKLFFTSLRLSQVEDRLQTLVQIIAIEDYFKKLELKKTHTSKE